MSDVADHNSGQWLAVIYADGIEHYQHRHRYRRGWYVVRTCPCHPRVPVTRSYATEAEAWSAVGALLAVSMTLEEGPRCAAK